MGYFRFNINSNLISSMVEGLLAVIPALAVVVLAAIFFNRMSRQQPVQDTQDRGVARDKILFPLQVQAYERLTILLERITPSPLVMRINEQEMNSAQLQLALLKAIRDEYEHNVAMQIYISDALWAKVVAARDESASVIQMAASMIEAGAPSIRLCQQVFELESQRGNKGIRIALASIKQELNQFLD